MAREIRRFTATIPAGTPIAAPATVDVSFPPRIVRSLDWRLPPGALGVLGWQLAMQGVQVLPTSGDTWIIDDGTGGTFTLDGYPDSGAYQVIAYNTGAFQHSLMLTFHLDPIERPKPVPQQLAAPLLSSYIDLSQAGPPVRRRP